MGGRGGSALKADSGLDPCNGARSLLPPSPLIDDFSDKNRDLRAHTSPSSLTRLSFQGVCVVEETNENEGPRSGERR